MFHGTEQVASETNSVSIGVLQTLAFKQLREEFVCEVASVVHGAPPAELVEDRHLERVAQFSGHPALLEAAARDE